MNTTTSCGSSCFPWTRSKGRTDFYLWDAPRLYTRDDLSKATLNFSDHRLLGIGGYGFVYRAVFPSGVEAAVKVITNATSGLHQHSFAAELATLGNLRHRNLVQFKGWCFTTRELFLVYDYMPNKSLDTHLFHQHQDQETVLPWPARCRIVAGVAEGLVYLHDVAQVVHRDIKSANILLDSKLNACISDFGLARMIQCYHSIDPSGSFGARYSSIFSEATLGDGSDGYTAPECIGKRAQPTPLSDVFSFGVLLFEILSARKAAASTFLLVDWIHSLFSENRLLAALDPQLKVSASVEIEEAVGLFNLGLHCTQREASNRPSMSQVLHRLHHIASNRPPQIQHEPHFYETILRDSMLDIKTESSSLLAIEERQLNLEHCSMLVRAPQACSWKDIVVATHKFCNLIGFGFDSIVYLGQAFNQLVAVKVSRTSMRIEYLITELRFLGKIRHRNILTLMGWSSDPITNRCALVYDYMPNGSLWDWLREDDRVLPWEVRFRIAKELGVALFHLHENCDVPIIHKNINPRCVLLDSEFHVRLAGLGIAISATEEEGSLTKTTFYLDPEYSYTHAVTKYTDVNAYGIVMLQLVTGMHQVFHLTSMLVEWFELQKYSSMVHVSLELEGALNNSSNVPSVIKLKGASDDMMVLPVDVKLKGAYDESELKVLIGLGLLCSFHQSKDRPNMRRALDILYFQEPLQSLLNNCGATISF